MDSKEVIIANLEHIRSQCNELSGYTKWRELNDKLIDISLRCYEIENYVKGKM